MGQRIGGDEDSAGKKPDIHSDGCSGYAFAIKYLEIRQTDVVGHALELAQVKHTLRIDGIRTTATGKFA